MAISCYTLSSILFEHGVNGDFSIYLAPVLSHHNYRNLSLSFNDIVIGEIQSSLDDNVTRGAEKEKCENSSYLRCFLGHKFSRLVIMVHGELIDLCYIAS